MPVSVAARIFSRSGIVNFAIASRLPESTVLNGSTSLIRLRLRQHRHPFEAVDHLRVHGLLDPRGAVLIERDDTRRRRHELWTRLVGGRLHEFEDGPLGGAVVPGGERIRLCAHTCVTRGPQRRARTLPRGYVPDDTQNGPEASCV